jgi:hypothetical protein
VDTETMDLVKQKLVVKSGKKNAPASCSKVDRNV